MCKFFRTSTKRGRTQSIALTHELWSSFGEAAEGLPGDRTQTRSKYRVSRRESVQLREKIAKLDGRSSPNSCDK